MIELIKKFFGFGQNEKLICQEKMLAKTYEYNENARKKAITYLGTKWIVHPENFVKKIQKKRTYRKKLKNVIQS